MTMQCEVIIILVFQILVQSMYFLSPPRGSFTAKRDKNGKSYMFCHWADVCVLHPFKITTSLSMLCYISLLPTFKSEKTKTLGSYRTFSVFSPSSFVLLTTTELLGPSPTDVKATTWNSYSEYLSSPVTTWLWIVPLLIFKIAGNPPESFFLYNNLNPLMIPFLAISGGSLQDAVTVVELLTITVRLLGAVDGTARKTLTFTWYTCTSRLQILKTACQTIKPTNNRENTETKQRMDVWIRYIWISDSHSWTLTILFSPLYFNRTLWSITNWSEGQHLKFIFRVLIKPSDRYSASCSISNR